ncbi:MAG: ferrous iron transport protein A [Verrucomicrobia bacterium]|jgi:ferrous iron transport protein A|nr:ferrous iron transport protein A [Verrucomicrobiota bacterium]
MPSPSCLSDLEQGTSAVIDFIPTGDASMTRLRELGLLPGTRIQLIRRAPMGDPIEISVRGSLISLRKQEADLIEIKTA